MLSKYNKNNPKYTFKQLNKDTPFKELSELFKEYGNGQFFTVRGLYINTKSIYGDNPTIVLDNAFVNLPKHLLDTVKEMRQDEELTTAINNGKIGFQIYEYTQENYNKKCYSVTWVEVE